MLSAVQMKTITEIVEYYHAVCSADENNKRNC
jgi:hypothetical protein